MHPNNGAGGSGVTGGLKGMAKPPKAVKTTTLTVKLIWLLLGAFFLITLISQIYMLFYVPLKTEVALYYETTADLRFKGVYIRDERQISYETNGIVAYTNKDGSKLAIDSVIAKVYSSKEDILSEHKIAEYEEQIKSLSEAKTFAGTDSTQLDAFLGQLTDKYLQILNAIDDGDFEKAAKCKSDYLSLRSKIDVVKGVSSGYSEQISSLEDEINRLRARIKTPKDITVSESGYFVSTADGYESSLKYEDAFSLTKEQVESIIKKPLLNNIAPNVVGKVIDNYKWRMAAVLEAEKTRGIYENAKVSLIIGASQRTTQAVVRRITDLGDGTKLFIFECDLMTDEFVRKRVTGVRILLDDYSGIRISQAAVRFNEAGERGVYVLSGAAVEFKRIELVHTEADYVIAENIDKPGYLKLYDKVIVGGKDLYDGKIVS